MPREPKTKAELEAIVLAELRKQPRCEDVAGVGINAYAEQPGWWLNSAQLGNAGARDCLRGIDAVMDKLRHVYTLEVSSL